MLFVVLAVMFEIELQVVNAALHRIVDAWIKRIGRVACGWRGKTRVSEPTVDAVLLQQRKGIGRFIPAQ